MNPLTNVKNINKLNEREAELGIGSKSSWHQQYSGSAYIFVGGLPYDLTEGDIICVFSQYGEIVNINLVRDKKTGNSKGYCFLAYEDQRSTVLTVDNLNGIKLLGRTLRVDHVSEYRKPKEDENADEVTKKLREEGCAPKTPSPSPSENEADEPAPHHKQKDAAVKKAKKKVKKEKKKKKKEKVSSSSDSDNKPNSKGDKGNYQMLKDKKEKRDSPNIKTERHIYSDASRSCDEYRKHRYAKESDQSHGAKGKDERKRTQDEDHRERDPGREISSRKYKDNVLPKTERDCESYLSSGRDRDRDGTGNRGERNRYDGHSERNRDQSDRNRDFEGSRHGYRDRSRDYKTDRRDREFSRRDSYRH